MLVRATVKARYGRPSAVQFGYVDTKQLDTGEVGRGSVVISKS